MLNQKKLDETLEHSIRSLFREIGGYFSSGPEGSKKRRVILGKMNRGDKRMIAAGYDTLELRPGFITLEAAHNAIEKLQNAFQRADISTDINTICIVPKQWTADKNMPALRAQVEVGEEGVKKLENALMILAHS